MLPAIIATLLWSYCVIAARRSVHQLGENQANLARLFLAVVAMGLIAHFLGQGLGGGGLGYFILSGIIGFGLGDIGIFYALPRIGSRLTLLMAQCVAVPVAGLTEWLWLGILITPMQVLAILIILVGITIALIPKRMPAESMRDFTIGLIFGLLAAFGQGLGAVISRKAYEQARLAGNWVENESVWQNILMGATTGYQRLLGGFAMLALFYILTIWIRSWRTYAREPYVRDPIRKKLKFVVLTAAAGPVFGIICFQWALGILPSAIVQTIVATTPLVVMPLAYFLEGDRPSLRAIVGTVISVAGVIVLALV